MDPLVGLFGNENDIVLETSKTPLFPPEVRLMYYRHIFILCY